MPSLRHEPAVPLVGPPIMKKMVSTPSFLKHCAITCSPRTMPIDFAPSCKLFAQVFGYGSSLPSWERDRVRGSPAVLKLRHPLLLTFPRKGRRKKFITSCKVLPYYHRSVSF